MIHLECLPPLALYIHLPWCIKKCPYCDFNSHVNIDALPEGAYIDALLLDLRQELSSLTTQNIVSIFIGGGTPSLFKPESINKLITDLHKQFNLSANTEITLEANPGAMEYSRFQEFRDCGINRISIGVQSFQAQLLKNLGRIHSGNEALKAIEAASLAGFASINIDLMYGLPQQTLEQAINDLNTALDLQAPHISHYQLTIEPNTAFHNRRPALPPDERIWSMQQQCQHLLKEAGYNHYETSAYAKPGHHCEHNINYWEFGDYLGIGAGAHQKLTSIQNQKIMRRHKQRLPLKYIHAVEQKSHIEGESAIDNHAIAFEFMLNALRLTEGFQTTLFTERTGLPISSIAKPLKTAQDKGLLSYTPQHIRPSQQGQLFLNELLMLFME